MSAIKVEQLCKSYGPRQVLHNIDLRVDSGRLVGFLGPNGAGKTTTIRILLGLLASDSGVAEIFGQDCRQYGQQLRAEVGYLPGDVHLYPNLTGRATLKFFARARRKNSDDEISRLAEVFGLALDKTVRRYSTGMRQKLGLMQALMHKPQLLILDEPTSGLDPLVRQAVFQELRNVVREGRTVLFSSHLLDEVEELCDDVVILREGRIVEHQKIETLRKRALKRIEIKFRSDIHETVFFPDQMRVIKRERDIVQGTWSGEIEVLLSWLRNHEIQDLVVERPGLNDLFVTYYSEQGQ